MSRLGCSVLIIFTLLAACYPQASSQAKSKTSTATLDPGYVTTNGYRNKSLGLICKIPDSWVFRTDEMNAGDNQKPSSGKVLLAAFSRPPAAKGEEINSSIVIAAEPVATYPGLEEAAQYFGPLTEVAKAQGFSVDEEPYGIALGARTLVRADYHKDVGSRVMRQSTLALLSQGYAISITLIAGTENDVEELVDGLTFTIAGKK